VREVKKRVENSKLLVKQVKGKNETKKRLQLTPAPFRNHQNYNINVYPLVVFIYRGHELGFGRIIRPLLYLLQLRGKIDKQRQCGNAS
jgi:hypothetical protein